jgi:hypothetical protein
VKSSAPVCTKLEESAIERRVYNLWIALAANQLGSNLHIDDKTLRRRRRDNSTTSTVSNRCLFLKLRSRLIFARSLIDLWARRRQLKL